MYREPPVNVMAQRGKAVFIAVLVAFLIGTAGVAAFPDLAQIAAPLVCHGQSLVTTTTSYSSSPRSGGTQTALACVDATGTRTELGALFIVLAITLELGLPFAAIGWWISAQVWPARKPVDDDDS
jgi:hypothetical protein